MDLCSGSASSSSRNCHNVIFDSMASCWLLLFVASLLAVDGLEGLVEVRSSHLTWCSECCIAPGDDIDDVGVAGDVAGDMAVVAAAAAAAVVVVAAKVSVVALDILRLLLVSC